MYELFYLLKVQMHLFTILTPVAFATCAADAGANSKAGRSEFPVASQLAWRAPAKSHRVL
jgi:hypothetical protein